MTLERYLCPRDESLSASRDNEFLRASLVRSWPVRETHALLNGPLGSSASGQVTELGSLELSGAANDLKRNLEKKEKGRTLATLFHISLCRWLCNSEHRTSNEFCGQTVFSIATHISSTE
jgi:hypothetical protein